MKDSENVDYLLKLFEVDGVDLTQHVREDVDINEYMRNRISAVYREYLINGVWDQEFTNEWNRIFFKESYMHPPQEYRTPDTNVVVVNGSPHIIEGECWLSTPNEVATGNRINEPREVIPYWKDMRRPTVDKRTIQSYREWPCDE